MAFYSGNFGDLHGNTSVLGTPKTPTIIFDENKTTGKGLQTSVTKKRRTALENITNSTGNNGNKGTKPTQKRIQLVATPKSANARPKGLTKRKPEQLEAEKMFKFSHKPEVSIPGLDLNFDLLKKPVNLNSFSAPVPKDPEVMEYEGRITASDVFSDDLQLEFSDFSGPIFEEEEEEILFAF